MYKRTVLENQSLDSLNIGKGVSVDVIIAKEDKQLLLRTYVTIEDVKYIVVVLKNIVLWYMYQKTNYLRIMD